KRCPLFSAADNQKVWSRPPRAGFFKMEIRIDEINAAFTRLKFRGEENYRPARIKTQRAAKAFTIFRSPGAFHLEEVIVDSVRGGKNRETIPKIMAPVVCIRLADRKYRRDSVPQPIEKEPLGHEPPARAGTINEIRFRSQQDGNAHRTGGHNGLKAR